MKTLHCCCFIGVVADGAGGVLERAARHQVPGVRDGLRQQAGLRARRTRIAARAGGPRPKLEPRHAQGLHAGAGRPDLRAAHGGPDSRRRVRRRPVLPERHLGPASHPRDRRRPARARGQAPRPPSSNCSASTSGAARCSIATNACCGTASTTLTLLKPHHGDRYLGSAQVRGRRPRPVAAVSGAAVLRPEPARLPARVDHHRLRLHRRNRGLRREAGLPRRPPRLQCARRDPHGAPGLLPRPRLHRQGLPAEFHALQRRTSPSATDRRS